MRDCSFGLEPGTACLGLNPGLPGHAETGDRLVGAITQVCSIRAETQDCLVKQELETAQSRPKPGTARSGLEPETIPVEPKPSTAGVGPEPGIARSGIELETIQVGPRTRDSQGRAVTRDRLVRPEPRTSQVGKVPGTS